MAWRKERRKPIWREKGGTEFDRVEEVTEFTAYCCACRKNKGTMAGKYLGAVNFYHKSSIWDFPVTDSPHRHADALHTASEWRTHPSRY